MKIEVTIRRHSRVRFIDISIDGESVGTLAAPPKKAISLVEFLEEGVSLAQNCGGSDDEIHVKEILN